MPREACFYQLSGPTIICNGTQLRQASPYSLEILRSGHVLKQYQLEYRFRFSRDFSEVLLYNRPRLKLKMLSSNSFRQSKLQTKKFLLLLRAFGKPSKQAGQYAMFAIRQNVGMNAHLFATKTALDHSRK